MFASFFYRRTAPLLVLAGMALLMHAPNALAARLSLYPSSGAFKEGCQNTVSMIVNTQGQASNAADAILSYDPSEIEVLTVQNGSAYETYLGKSFSGGKITLTAFSISASLNGSANFGNIIFRSKPGVTGANINFTFSPGSTTDSNVAALDSSDMLSSVGNGSYSFTTGPCFADGQPPTVTDVDPAPLALGVPLDTQIRLHVRDNQAGVDMPTVKITVNGTEYRSSGSNAFSFSGTELNYALVLTPAEPFLDGEPVSVRVEAKDKEGNTMAPYQYVFNLPTPEPLPPPPAPTCEALGCPLICPAPELPVCTGTEAQPVLQSSLTPEQIETLEAMLGDEFREDFPDSTPTLDDFIILRDPRTGALYAISPKVKRVTLTELPATLVHPAAAPEQPNWLWLVIILLGLSFVMSSATAAYLRYRCNILERKLGLRKK